MLPVDKTVKIHLESRDVIHSFWIVDFLYKKDMTPGTTNYWSFTPTREGMYAGKCAELCGEYHSAMLFNVEVVSEDEYEGYLASLRDAGQTGDINDAYDRQQNLPGTGGDAESRKRTTDWRRRFRSRRDPGRPTTLPPRQAALLSATRVEQKGNIIVQWITSTDHKTIGYMYLIASVLFFLSAV